MQHLSPHIQTLLNDPGTQAFLKAARQYVALMENGSLKEEEFFREMHKTLAELYRAALSLKNIPLKFSDSKSEFYVTEEEIMKISGSVLSYIASRYYHKIFDPTTLEDETVTACLHDDLTDIYKDIKEPLMDHTGTDKAVEEALWQLHFGFKHHWGFHAVDALRYLHYMSK